DQYLKKVFRVDREYAGGEALFGKVGHCMYAHKEDQEISILDDQMNNRRVPISAVIEVNETLPTPKALLTFEHVSKNMKYQMLGRLGMVSADSAPPVEVKKDAALLEGGTIQLWSVLLEHTFPQANFFTWSPDSMCVYFSALRDQDEVCQKAMEEAMRRVLNRYDKVFFPLQCPEGAGKHKVGHWTLLVVETRNEGISLAEPRIRYYETMNEINEVCLDRADQILKAVVPDLSQQMLVTALTRHQIFRQSGTDCGYWVMHYIEVEVRRLAGEGGAPVTTPKDRKKAVINKCVSAAKQLEKARLAWLQEALFEEAKVKAAQQHLQAKADRKQTEQREAEELRRRAKEAALVSNWCKTLPDAIPEDPKEVRRRLQQEATQVLKDQVKATVKKILEAEAEAAEEKAQKKVEAQKEPAEPNKGAEEEKVEAQKKAQKEEAEKQAQEALAALGQKQKGEKGFEAWLR
ncbi:unnamed protein product, partial [Prorocentrum cordatum]